MYELSLVSAFGLHATPRIPLLFSLYPIDPLIYRDGSSFMGFSFFPLHRVSYPHYSLLATTRQSLQKIPQKCLKAQHGTNHGIAS